MMTLNALDTYHAVTLAEVRQRKVRVVTHLYVRCIHTPGHP